MPGPHAKTEKNWCTSFGDIRGQHTNFVQF